MTCARCGRPRAEHYGAKLDCPLGRSVRPGARFLESWLAELPEAIIEETQPALPGAEDVRAAEHATPAFELPYSLTAEADTTVRERARGLFEDEGGK